MSRIYSHSTLEAYALCRAQGQYARDLPRHEKEGPARAGNAGHAFLQRYLGYLYKQGESFNADVGQHIADHICARLSPREEGLARPAMKAAWETQIDWLRDFAETPVFERRLFLTLDGDHLSDSELSSTPGAIFALTPDMRGRDKDGVTIVVDHKTGWVARSIADDTRRQLLRYCSAVCGPDEPMAYARLFNPRLGVNDVVVFTREEMDACWRETVELISEIEAATEPAYSLGLHCQRCDFRWKCPAYKDIPQYAPPARIEDAAVRLARIEDEAAALRSHLREHIAEHGPIGDAVATCEVTHDERYTFTTSDLRLAMREWATDEQIDQCLSATKTSIKSGLKQMPGLSVDDRRAYLEAALRLGKKKLTPKLRVRFLREEAADDDGEEI